MKSLSKGVLAALVIVLIVGCAGLNLNLENNRDVVIYTVESLAVPIGYYAAQNEYIDTSLRQVYNLAVTGKLTPEAINNIVKGLDVDDPLQILMIKRGIRLLELVGAQVDGQTIVSLAGLDPELVEAAARGYVDGYDTYKLSHQSE